MDIHDRLFTEAGAGRYLGGDRPLSTRTLQRWRASGVGPRWVRVGGKAVRYRKSTLDAFLAASERQSTSET